MDYKKFNNYLNTFVFDTKINWPTITIFWWIHWDEIAWIKVIDKLIKNIEYNKLELLKWKLILAYWNLEAIKKWVRQINYNMNRIFRNDINYNNDSLEIKRMKELSKILDITDILLDIHSTSSESIPFMFAENFKNELNISKKIWTNKIIVWWEKNWGDLLSWDTNTYMHKLWKIAFTLESWQHKSNSAFDIWYNTVIKLLKYNNIIESNIKNNNKIDLIEMYKVHITLNWNFIFNESIENFSYIKKDYLIWFDWSEKIYAPENFIIVLPKYANTKPWEEIFYYWKKINN